MLANSNFCSIFAVRSSRRGTIAPRQLTEHQYDGGVAQLVRASDS